MSQVTNRQGDDADSGVDLIWYGERGAVNSLVVAVQKAGRKGVKELLSLVRGADNLPWSDNKKFDWIRWITSSSLIVEVGLSQFGSPDLIIVCRTSNPEEEKKELHVVFVEAKVVTYENSAMSLSEGIQGKFNSSINGQLSLKYRFACALDDWKDPSKDIVEPEKIFTAYGRPVKRGLADQSKSRRKLHKLPVRELLKIAGITESNLKHFYFVALTTDESSPFKPHNFGDNDTRPLFLNCEGNEQWAETKGQLGWIGFSDISKVDSLKIHLGKGFQDVLDAMKKAASATARTQDSKQVEPPDTYDSDSTSQVEIKLLLDKIRKLALACFGPDTAEEKKRGSLSIKPLKRKILMKVVAQKSADKDAVYFIVLGVSASLGSRDWEACDMPTLMSSNGQEFYYKELPAEEGSLAIVESVFAELKEILDLNEKSI